MKTPLEIVSQVASRISATNITSLPEYTQRARLAPTLLIDKSLLSIDIKQIVALEQTLLSLYSGYYLMAVNMTMNVGNVNVMRLLDQFSTSRQVDFNDVKSVTKDFAKEFGLESYDEFFDGAYLPSFGLEAEFQNLDNVNAEPKDKKQNKDKSDKNKGEGAAKGAAHEEKNITPLKHDKTIQNITDESNLVVGKILEVNIHSPNGKAQTIIPVMVTLNPKSIDPKDFVAICEANSMDKSYMGRYHQWRSGEIRGWQDYLLCQDIIEADKKALLADKTGSLLAIRSKRTQGIMKALVTGYGSPNSVSAMIIVSKKTAADVQLALKGRLSDYHIRQRYFDDTSSMMLVVVDPVLEYFTIYQRGIHETRDHTFEDIKGNAKKPNAVDIDSIIKAYRTGSAPVI